MQAEVINNQITAFAPETCECQKRGSSPVSFTDVLMSMQALEQGNLDEQALNGISVVNQSLLIDGTGLMQPNEKALVDPLMLMPVHFENDETDEQIGLGDTGKSLPLGEIELAKENWQIGLINPLTEMAPEDHVMQETKAASAQVLFPGALQYKDFPLKYDNAQSAMPGLPVFGGDKTLPLDNGLDNPGGPFGTAGTNQNTTSASLDGSSAMSFVEASSRIAVGTEHSVINSGQGLMENKLHNAQEAKSQGLYAAISANTSPGKDETGFKSLGQDFNNQHGSEKAGKNIALSNVNGHSQVEAGNTNVIQVSGVTPQKFQSTATAQIINAVQDLVKNNNGVTIIKLKLEPQSLGEINIRLTFNNGEMDAHFHVASGLVKDALESSIPQLRETLSQLNINLGEATASWGGYQQQGQNNHGFEKQSFNQNFPAGNVYSIPVDEPASLGQINENKALDLLI